MAALVALAAALWFALGDAARPGAGPPIEAAAPAIVDRASDAGRALDERAVAAPLTDRSSVTPAANQPVSVAPVLALRGRIVNAAREPLEGAALEVLSSEADGYQNLDPELRKTLATLARGVSDADGRFRIELEERGLVRLRVSRAGFAERSVDELRASYDETEEHDLVLLRGATVRGRVLRKRDKSAVANVLVRATDPARSFERDSHTDANGLFVLTGIPPAPFQFSAMPAVGDACSGWIACDALEGQVLERDIELPRGVLVHGRITDATTGAPIVGAEVGEGWALHRSVRTSADGRYEFEGFTRDPGEVAVRAVGYGRAERSFSSQGIDAFERDFALQPARRARGRVVDVLGESIEGVYVAATANARNARGEQQVDWIASRTDAQGEFALDGLRPDVRHTLVARRRGHGSVVYDFPASEFESPTVDLGTLVLPAPGAVRGRVLDELGEPHVGREVLLVGTNPDRARMRAEIEYAKGSIDAYVAKRTTRTDGNGRFGFDDVAPGKYDARVQRPGLHHYDTHPVTVAASQTNELQVHMLRGATISGRVVASDGGELPRSAYIAFLPEEGGRNSGAAVRVDGSFSVAGLTGARYTLRVDAFVEEGLERDFLTTTRTAVAAGTSDLELTLRVARRRMGVVLDLEGAPICDAAVEVLDLDGSVLDATTSYPDGQFSLKTLLDGPRPVRVQPPREYREPYFDVLREIDPHSDAPIEFRVPRRKP